MAREKQEEPAAEAAPELSYREQLEHLNPIAQPLASRKLTRKLYKCIRKGVAGAGSGAGGSAGAAQPLIRCLSCSGQAQADPPGREGGAEVYQQRREGVSDALTLWLGVGQPLTRAFPAGSRCWPATRCPSTSTAISPSCAKTGICPTLTSPPSR